MSNSRSGEADKRLPFYEQVVKKEIPCASDEELRAYVNEDPERFTHAKRAQLAHHIQGCKRCAANLIKVTAEEVNQDNVAELSAQTMNYSDRARGITDAVGQPKNSDPENSDEEPTVEHISQHLLDAIADGTLIPDDLDPDERRHFEGCEECSFYTLARLAAEHGINRRDLLALEQGTLNDQSKEKVEAHLQRCPSCARFYRKLIVRNRAEARKTAAAGKASAKEQPPSSKISRPPSTKPSDAQLLADLKETVREMAQRRGGTELGKRAD